MHAANVIARRFPNPAAALAGGLRHDKIRLAYISPMSAIIRSLPVWCNDRKHDRENSSIGFGTNADDGSAQRAA
jgi:hypothetical protein